MEPSKELNSKFSSAAPHAPERGDLTFPKSGQITFRKLRGGILVGLGYLLSPLCWWNDLVFNLPVAWGIGYLFGLISPNYFVPGAIAGYWLSNLVGILLMQFGAVDVFQNPVSDRNLTKELLMGVATSTAYTLFILVLCHFKVIDLSTFLPSEQLFSIGNS
ncbi:hypothetical protein K9N68_36100 (plasmid) [Kovacikia minuta CCNUW1]|uniref:hypothetical protein n=1 Tax=Kovacikia minuta TaxID=2931930 RepID=UPI001CCEC144|nr:hypothetical protein [Kovacikia minuta]UBF30600.1 hypothetical protein K9N68_36100 [Kovacikia minuta CCNUW1]